MTTKTLAERIAREAQHMRHLGATDAEYANAAPGYASSVEDDARRRIQQRDYDAMMAAIRDRRATAELDAAFAAAKTRNAAAKSLAIAHLGIAACECQVVNRGSYLIVHPHGRKDIGVRVNADGSCRTIDYTRAA